MSTLTAEIRVTEAAAGGLAAAKSGVGGAAAGCMYWDTCKASVGSDVFL